MTPTLLAEGKEILRVIRTGLPERMVREKSKKRGKTDWIISYALREPIQLGGYKILLENPTVTEFFNAVECYYVRLGSKDFDTILYRTLKVMPSNAIDYIISELQYVAEHGHSRFLEDLTEQIKIYYKGKEMHQALKRALKILKLKYGVTTKDVAKTLGVSVSRVGWECNEGSVRIQGLLFLTTRSFEPEYKFFIYTEDKKNQIIEALKKHDKAMLEKALSEEERFVFDYKKKKKIIAKP